MGNVSSEVGSLEGVLMSANLMKARAGGLFKSLLPAVGGEDGPRPPLVNWPASSRRVARGEPARRAAT
jgi:hypothetical protein